jgi:hypothetical protein
MWLFEKKISGLIAAHGLGEWWSATLTDDDRNTILLNYRPLEGSPRYLIDGEAESADDSAFRFLACLATWMKRKDASLRWKILVKSEELEALISNTEDEYWGLHDLIEGFYLVRKEFSEAASHCEVACRRQIALWPLMAPILEKDGIRCCTGAHRLFHILLWAQRYDEAIDYAQRQINAKQADVWPWRLKKVLRDKAKRTPIVK